MHLTASSSGGSENRQLEGGPYNAKSPAVLATGEAFFGSRAV